jgi:uncharacterized membrane protein (DUF485 family)
MAGLDFQSTTPKEQENEEHVRFNSRLGVSLFFIYVVFYAGFMLLSAFAPHVMGTPIVAGLHLSVVYGFLLIVIAIVLALVYVTICKQSGKAG